MKFGRDFEELRATWVEPSLTLLRRGGYSEPHPFPGKHPLRLYWRVGAKEHWGKFTPAAIRAFQRETRRATNAARRTGFTLVFDRKMRICYTRSDVQSISFYDLDLSHYYFRRQDPNGIFAALTDFELTRNGLGERYYLARRTNERSIA
jgi:hypothetical protein